MSDHCFHCDTRERIIVPKQLSADDDVSSGRITEGKYLEICRITKKLYENLMEICYCKEQEKEEDEDDGAVIRETVTRYNTIHLNSDLLAASNIRLNQQVVYTERRFNNQGSVVFLLNDPENNNYLRRRSARVVEAPITDFTPLNNIYYDSNDNQFKSQENWFNDFAYNWYDM
jgi:hypothetical protein